jgi:hypothetical protein
LAKPPRSIVGDSAGIGSTACSGSVVADDANPIARTAASRFVNPRVALAVDTSSNRRRESVDTPRILLFQPRSNIIISTLVVGVDAHDDEDETDVAVRVIADAHRVMTRGVAGRPIAMSVRSTRG